MLRSLTAALAPKMSTGNGSVKCAAPLLTVNRCLRILRRPGKPLDLNAVQPGEHRASADAPAGDVPVPAGPLVDKRRLPFRAIDRNVPSPAPPPPPPPPPTPHPQPHPPPL